MAGRNTAYDQVLVLHLRRPRKGLTEERALHTLADGMLYGQRCSKSPFTATPLLQGALSGSDQQGLDHGQRNCVCPLGSCSLPPWLESQRTWLGHAGEEEQTEGSGEGLCTDSLAQKPC